ncbi:hypothetical protein D3C72_2573800 [compost metagenome]
MSDIPPCLDVPIVQLDGLDEAIQGRLALSEVELHDAQVGEKLGVRMAPLL